MQTTVLEGFKRILKAMVCCVFLTSPMYGGENKDNSTISSQNLKKSLPLHQKNKPLVKGGKKKKKVRHVQKTKKRDRPYSAPAIEKILENDAREPECNRLNCASSLKIAQACLPNKEFHRKHKKCFRAFCAYGCNETDYNNNAEVHAFCNKTCASKKYQKYN